MLLTKPDKQDLLINTSSLHYPRAVFLDLDDTITSFDVSSAPAWEQSCQEFVEKYEPEFSVEGLLRTIREVKKWYWQDPVRHKRGRENLTLARREVVYYALERYAGADYFREEEKNTGNLLEASQTNRRTQHCYEFADRYTELQNQLIQPLPGTVEALQQLRTLGIRLAVVTNGISTIQREKLQRFGLTEYFEEVFIDTEVGYSKPDQRMFEYALQKMELSPEEVWMVGDNINWDVRGPQQIGIFSVWYNTKQAELPADYEVQPDFCIKSLLEIVDVLKEIKL